MSQFNFDGIDRIFEAKQSTIARDLKLNLKKLLGESSLAPREAWLTLLASAQTVEHRELIEEAKSQLATQDLTAEQIQEAQESAAIMGMNNVYYRFRHFTHNKAVAEGRDSEYRSAGLRMTGLARPALGKEQFEMLAFAVSAINGCENCVNSHEKSLKDVGVTAEKIHDLARLAAVVKGLKALSF
jgi:lipoyl-dependent peroxiredoxin subunit D